MIDFPRALRRPVPTDLRRCRETPVYGASLHTEDSEEGLQEFVRALKRATRNRRTHADLIERVERLERAVRENTAEIAELKGLVGEAELPPLGEFELWKDSAAADQYAGMHVAFVPGKGVIASAETLGDLLDQIGDSEAVIGHVLRG